jgi:hypothetical protein
VWQMQALRMAQLAGLEVPRQTWDGMHKWLDHCASDEGATYGYMGRTRGSTMRMSAAGLLCRQFLGWKANYPPLKKGTELLFRVLPDPKRKDILHYYWVTQVMHHQGGGAWAAWNPKMRDLLIDTQDRSAEHSQGSWSSAGDAFQGQLGRLGITSLSLLILEIYYSVDLPNAEQQPREAELLSYWGDLGWTSSLTPRQAIGALAEAPAHAVAFLGERVRPVSTTVTPQRLEQLLANLDDRQFEVRRRASEELEKLGELAEVVLRQGLAKTPPLEVQQRIERILAAIERQAQTPERLQVLRAIQALERIGTPEARQLLEKVAQGNPEARLTREARAALERLTRPE